MSRHHRGIVGPRRWQRLRRQVFESDGHRCRCCGMAGRLEADHITPLAAGGDPWDPENVQALCRGCHIRKTRAERPPGRIFGPAAQRWANLVADLSSE